MRFCLPLPKRWGNSFPQWEVQVMLLSSCPGEPKGRVRVTRLSISLASFALFCFLEVLRNDANVSYNEHVGGVFGRCVCKTVRSFPPEKCLAWACLQDGAMAPCWGVRDGRKSIPSCKTCSLLAFRFNIDFATATIFEATLRDTLERRLLDFENHQHILRWTRESFDCSSTDRSPSHTS